MSVQLECDRCGFQEQTSGVMLLARFVGPGIPSLRPELPSGWTRPRLPNEDGSADDRELCPGCKADLFRFMAGGQVVDTPPTVCRGCGHHEGEGCGCPPQRVSICPTCGPMPLEQHPSLPAVNRCSNCKEHLGEKTEAGTSGD